MIVVGNKTAHDSKVSKASWLSSTTVQHFGHPWRHRPWAASLGLKGQMRIYRVYMYIHIRYIYIYTRYIKLYTLYIIWLLYFESLKTPDPKKLADITVLLPGALGADLRLDDTSDPAGFRQPAGKVSIDLQRHPGSQGFSGFRWIEADHLRILKRILQVGSLQPVSNFQIGSCDERIWEE